jgi:alpha-amylase/alpha-mannosidase (GH57 family)
MSEVWTCIHGHFYQPPRENPWLEAIEVQDSAAPYHDWNARVTAECYHPNATSRILDGDGHVEEIVNNYERTSFDFGPTVLSWLEEHAPHTYARILRADRDGAARFGGHGPAIAQAYNHIIMPLANERDRRTQVRWGIADFVHRFQRSPEGMWLPETAACVDTLEALAEHDVDFTILAPHQAAAVRPLGGGEPWYDLRANEAGVDTTRPYRVELPSGRHIDVFFYDGDTSNAVAFAGLLERGERLAERLRFAAHGDGPRLAHIATDGESCGHHHRHGDMALAWAQRCLERSDEVRLTVYGEFLAEVPPTHAVRIAEHTSWSCAHGVERWRSHCGCAADPGRGWDQGWRGPLREALDWLRDEVAPRYEAVAGELLGDPWEARDAYIDVILDRSDETRARFLRNHARGDAGAEARVAIFELMELQRHAQLMYTSCGWFFDDVSGLETQQILGYASRVCQLAHARLDVDLEAGFLERLAAARSNLPEQEDGAQVYRRHIKPMRLDLARVAAHQVVDDLYREERARPELTPGAPSLQAVGERERTFCYAVTPLEREASRIGDAAILLGRLRVTSLVTTEEADFSFVGLRFGAHNVTGGVVPAQGGPDLGVLRDELQPLFARGAFPEVVRALVDLFGDDLLTLQGLFRDEQRRIIAEVMASSVRDTERRLAETFRARLPLMRFAGHLGVPQPRVFRAAAEIVLNGELHRALAVREPNAESVASLLENARGVGVPLDRDGLAFTIAEPLCVLADELVEVPEYVQPIERLHHLVALIRTLPFEVSTRVAQDRWFELRDRQHAAACRAAAAGDEDAARWLEAFEALGETLRCVVPPRAAESAQRRAS